MAGTEIAGIRRRHLGMTAGQSLLLPDSTFHTIRRAAQWLDFSGMQPADILTTPLMAMPVPMGTRVPGGRRRWWGTRVEAMWHPLMWLPPRLASRRTWRGRRGRMEHESFHDWSARVGLELEGSAVMVVDGRRVVRTYDPDRRKVVRLADSDDSHLVPLYDPATGTWLDILAIAGIDIDSRQGKAQVAAWLDGYPSPELDDFDLDRFLIARGRRTEWPEHHLARRLDTSERSSYSEELRSAAAGKAAAELIGMVEDTMYPVTGRLPFATARAQLTSLTWLARTAIGSMGKDPRGATWTTSLLARDARRAQNDLSVDALAREFVALMRLVLEHNAGAGDRLARRAQVEEAEVRTQLAKLDRPVRRGLRGLLGAVRA